MATGAVHRRGGGSPAPPELESGRLEANVRDGSAQAAARLFAELLGGLGAVSLLSEDERRFELLAFHHEDESKAAQFRRALEGADLDLQAWPRSAAVIAERRPLVTDLESDAARTNPALGAYVREAAAHSVLIVPLIARGRPIGTAGVMRERGRSPFSRPDLALAERVAGEIALHLDNACLYDALRVSEERFRSVVMSLEEGVLVMDGESRVAYANPAAVRILGMTEEELYGEDDWWRAVNTEFEDLTPLIDEGGGNDPLVQRMGDVLVRITRPDGRRATLSVSYQALRAGGGDGVAGMVVSFQDVTERRRAEERLRHQALHDPLTGLPNRTQLLDRMAAAMEHTAQGSGSVAVVLLDLDNFKIGINSLGHEVGDSVLLQIAPRLREALRAGDTLAHLGGDEFAVLCRGIAGSGEAEESTRRMLDAFERPFSIPEGEHVITASAGVAVNEPPRADPASLLRDANAALQTAKRGGPGRHALFDETMRRDVLGRVALEGALRRAFQERRFKLGYQPIVALESGAPRGVEALIRWDDPEAPPEGPSKFIPIAEESGLIVPLGLWVLEEACRHASAWLERHPRAPWAVVNVNVSGRQLAEAAFPSTVARVLRETGLDPGRLALEITETALMEGGESIRVLEELKGIGVRLVLDDFGTGYSSLSYLAEFPIDELKIDSSFVVQLSGEGSTFPIVEAVAGMAQALGLVTVAEGVEEDEQLQALRELDCDSVQGFLCAPPMPADEVEAWLAGRVGDGPRLQAGAGAEEMVTLRDAAEALGVSRSTVRRWADAGKIRSVRTAGGHRRVALAGVRRLSGSQLRASPVVRRLDLPEGPITPLAEALETDGARVAESAARAIYAQRAAGWFGSERAEEALREWTAAVARAAREGAYGTAVEASDALMRRAKLSGATLLERHLFIEAFSEAMSRVLAVRSTPREALVSSRRLFTSLRQRGLERH